MTRPFIAAASMPLAKNISETAFGTVLMDTAHALGWRAMHPRVAVVNARRGASGQLRYATAYQGDGGFPDWMLAHPQRGVLVAELKVPYNLVEPEQVKWLDLFDAAGFPTFLWYPRHWQTVIVPLLSGGWWTQADVTLAAEHGRWPVHGAKIKGGGVVA